MMQVKFFLLVLYPAIYELLCSACVMMLILWHRCAYNRSPYLHNIIISASLIVS